MATHPKQVTIYARHLKMLISLALLSVHLLRGKILVKQLLWNNILGISFCNDIVNANVSITAPVVNRETDLF